MSVGTPVTSSGSVPGTLEVVTFSAGGHRFAVEAAQVRTQLPAGHAAVLPAIEPLLGLSGGETQNLDGRRTLMMKHPAGDYAVTVSGPVEMRSLALSAIHPLPPLVVFRSRLPGIRGLATGEEGMTILLDLRALPVPAGQAG